ncbi:MAG: hypothetical protein ACRCXB_18525 [Aeromonadaceae bacterium]
MNETMKNAVYIARQYLRGHNEDAFWSLDANLRRAAHEVAMKCHQPEPGANLQSRLSGYRLEKLFGVR